MCSSLAKTYTHDFQAGIVSKWTDDSQRFLLEHFDTIKKSPFHIYHSALPLSPSSSWLHKFYSTDPSLTVKVVSGLLAKWGKCSRTVFMDSHTSTLSCWNNIVAIGSRPGNIIILDTITGSQAAVLSGHTARVSCVTFSSNGTLLVSGSDDYTVKLWDVQTGGAIKTFSGHTSVIYSVSISADCTIIASGSHDMTICLWDIQTEKCQCVIEQQDLVSHVKFSPTNPHYLISICGQKLWQWDINGHQINTPFDGLHIAFSSDGKQFVSCYLGVVTVQNSNSGEIVAKFQVAKATTLRCCFSLDSRLVAVAASFTIYVWDITSSNPHLVETLIGHTETIISLAFCSPSTLISTSWDKSVKFWQIGASSADPIMTDPESIPITLPLISSLSLQARDGIAISIDVDRVVKTWDIPVSLCKEPTKFLAEDYRLFNSRLVFVWYGDGRINIWNPEKGEFLLQEDVSEDHLLDLRISGDGSKIFHIDREFIRVWDLWTGIATGRVDLKYISNGESPTMDGSRIWVEMLLSSHFLGWDFGIPGSSPANVNTQPSHILHLNDTKLWDNSQCKIQDIVTGRVVFQLPKKYQSHIVEVQWNGQYLVISLISEKELILEFPPAFLL